MEQEERKRAFMRLVVFPWPGSAQPFSAAWAEKVHGKC